MQQYITDAAIYNQKISNQDLIVDFSIVL